MHSSEPPPNEIFHTNKWKKRHLQHQVQSHPLNPWLQVRQAKSNQQSRQQQHVPWQDHHQVRSAHILYLEILMNANVDQSSPPSLPLSRQQLQVQQAPYPQS